MARRANRRKSRSSSINRNVQKQRSTEALEARIVMSANPISGPMFGAHSIVDDAPALTQHQVPALTQHSFAPTLGQAVVESAPAYDPNADFWLGTGTGVDTIEDLGRQIEQNLREGHALTGQDDVIETYGLTGAGQTVAVIDSGIAYNHFALGGGRGEGYRVVGGWDFTENDDDFYDDYSAKSGAHGTHVAGIVGAAGGGTHQGVATGVDLVGLRVFDDAGNGYFSWVEQALQWVHTNRNAFDNPITAINLSLGIDQNSNTVPNWSMLEDEFAQLEADGIFISVSAGNSFQDYNTKGLSYPAASPHVIPVMASSNDGTLAPFSQRAERAISAPGRWITSTVPDYAANDGDTIDDDYLSMSGTSMAAPYVAGSSVLIREAMEFARQDVNHTDSWGAIDQWDIYNHMMDTADTFNDSATSTDFKRLNLKAAIDALMPEDDFGSSVETAHNLGTVNDSSGASPLSTLSGAITTLDDSDHFTFTAGVTGVVTISASQTTHALAAEWEAWGGAWSTNEAGDCVLEVVAGQTYRVGLSSSNGLGYYNLDVSAESTLSAVEWGAIGTQETRNWQASSNETWFSVTAGRTGYFTAEAMPQGGSATVAIYDAQQNLIASAGSRADVQAAAGDTLMLRVSGDASSFDLRMTNALTVGGGVATLLGTSGDDAINFTAGGTSHVLSLNSVEYAVDSSSIDIVQLQGVGGSDTLVYTGNASAESATLRSGTLTIAGDYGRVIASSVEDIEVHGGAGDTATFYDTAGDDRFVSSEASASMQDVAGAYHNRVTGFDRVLAYATSGGDDEAQLSDSAGDDQYTARPEYAILHAKVGNRWTFARGFDEVTAIANQGGNDSATFYDSAQDDNFVVRPGTAEMSDNTGAYKNVGVGFESVIGYSLAGGQDRAVYYDSTGDDTFFARPAYSVMWDAGRTFWHYTSAFERVEAYAQQGGNDRAVLHDSAGDDLLVTRPEFALMRDLAGSFLNYASGFDRVESYATAGGNDRASLYGSANDDRFIGRSEFGLMYDNTSSYWSYAAGFDRVDSYAGNGGIDRADLFDTDGDDDLFGAGDYAEIIGSANRTKATGFDTVRAVSGGVGQDSSSVSSIDYAFEQIGDWS